MVVHRNPLILILSMKKHSSELVDVIQAVWMCGFHLASWDHWKSINLAHAIAITNLLIHTVKLEAVATIYREETVPEVQFQADINMRCKFCR
jgi:hypothetical protein